ncbi:MAG TPA: sensor histidine kinase [Clostridiaceae bacterium]|nr:sensor histidine kinase [Clostridiaceae bacterium]
MLGKIKGFFVNSTVRQKLTLLFAVFILYPVLIVVFFGYFKYAVDIRKEIINSLDQRIERVNDFTTERFEQAKRFAMMMPYDGTLNELYVQKKNGEISQSDLFKNINEYLNSKFYSNQEIDALSFFFTDNSQVVYMVQSDNSYSRYINTIHPIVVEFASKLGEEQFGYYISDDGEFYLIRKMTDRYTFRQYGNVVIKVDKNYMLGYFRENFQNSSGFILTYNGASIFEQGQISEDLRSEVMKKIHDGTQPDENRFSIRPYEILTSSINLDNITLRYGVIMSTRTIMDKYNSAVRLLIILTVAVAIAMILMAVPLANAIWKPIKELVGLMKQLEEGNLGVQADRRKNDEFKFIFDSFNNMSNEIKHLFDVVYKEELARKEAQLAALQARINPHFLYNTLEIMNWKARINGNNELSEMIEALGTLLDAGMNKGGRTVSTLKDEIRLVDSYMFIMGKRFGKRLEFVKEIDESLLNGTIPRLIIQPLLENAVGHGVEPVGGGRIKLTVSLVNKRLNISVEDNGVGISDEDLAEFDKLFKGLPNRIKSSTGIGVRNVHERIKIIYGDEYGLTLEKAPAGGTLATITIPYIV